MGKFLREKTRIHIVRGWERGIRGSYCLMGYNFSVWDDQKVLEVDSGDGCMAL